MAELADNKDGDELLQGGELDRNCEVDMPVDFCHIFRPVQWTLSQEETNRLVDQHVARLPFFGKKPPRVALIIYRRQEPRVPGRRPSQDSDISPRTPILEPLPTPTSSIPPCPSDGAGSTPSRLPGVRTSSSVERMADRTRSRHRVNSSLKQTRPSPVAREDFSRTSTPSQEPDPVVPTSSPSHPSPARPESDNKTATQFEQRIPRRRRDQRVVLSSSRSSTDSEELENDLPVKSEGDVYSEEEKEVLASLRSGRLRRQSSIRAARAMRRVTDMVGGGTGESSKGDSRDREREILHAKYKRESGDLQRQKQPRNGGRPPRTSVRPTRPQQQVITPEIAARIDVNRALVLPMMIAALRTNTDVFTLKSGLYQQQLRRFAVNSTGTHASITHIRAMPEIPISPFDTELMEDLGYPGCERLLRADIDRDRQTMGIVDGLLTTWTNKLLLLGMVCEDSWYFQGPARDQVAQKIYDTLLDQYTGPFRQDILTIFREYVELRSRNFRDAIARFAKRKAPNPNTRADNLAELRQYNDLLASSGNMIIEGARNELPEIKEEGEIDEFSDNTRVPERVCVPVGDAKIYKETVDALGANEGYHRQVGAPPKRLEDGEVGHTSLEEPLIGMLRLVVKTMEPDSTDDNTFEKRRSLLPNVPPSKPAKDADAKLNEVDPRIHIASPSDYPTTEPNPKRMRAIF